MIIRKSTPRKIVRIADGEPKQFIVRTCHSNVEAPHLLFFGLPKTEGSDGPVGTIYDVVLPWSEVRRAVMAVPGADVDRRLKPKDSPGIPVKWQPGDGLIRLQHALETIRLALTEED